MDLYHVEFKSSLIVFMCKYRQPNVVGSVYVNVIPMSLPLWSTMVIANIQFLLGFCFPMLPLLLLWCERIFRWQTACRGCGSQPCDGPWDEWTTYLTHGQQDQAWICL